MACIVEYDVEFGTWKVLEPLREAEGREVHEVGWIKPGEELLVTHELEGKPAAGTVYSLTDGVGVFA